jgi:NAD(P)-dependent dehydrogenase (short-subunit alcohol dehydrogenase family)
VAIAFAREGADLLCSYWKEDEDAQRGIRINAVVPGPIWTPLVIMSFAAEKNAQFGGDTPLARPGQPGEPAPAYVFLATAESRYISGEVIGATGGKPLH